MSTLISHSHSASSPPKPSRMLVRSPSEPARLGTGAPQHKQIYVLSADGSRLFLVDPSTPANEEPPPYAPFSPSPTTRTAEVLPSIEGDDAGGVASEEPGPSINTRPASIRASVGSIGAVVPPRQRTAFPPLGHINDLLSFPNHFDQSQMHAAGTSHGHRHRASTISAVIQHPHPPPAPGPVPAVGNSATRRPRLATSQSQYTSPTRRTRTRSAMSSPGGYHSAVMPSETTPLLFSDGIRGGEEEDHVPLVAPAASVDDRRGLWRSITCGDLDDEEEIGNWSLGWRRFWRPCGRRAYWRAVWHLVLLNFPFALLVWPWLVVGTLAGTALLITLPIGAAVWWLTLFIARSAARLETIMQLHHHRPLGPSIPSPTYHPIFYRVKERSTPASPMSPIDELPPEIQWETRFTKCSYAMFADHYSYSALSYFLLIKPLITLFSTIVVLALLPVAFAGIFTLPMYLRAMRRWGKWQAGVAIENL